MIESLVCRRAATSRAIAFWVAPLAVWAVASCAPTAPAAPPPVTPAAPPAAQPAAGRARPRAGSARRPGRGAGLGLERAADQRLAGRQRAEAVGQRAARRTTRFDGGKYIPWTTSFSAPANGTAVVKDGQFCIDVTNKGVNAWDAQARHREMVIQKGHTYSICVHGARRPSRSR